MAGWGGGKNTTSFSTRQHAPMWGQSVPQRLSLQGCSLLRKSNKLSLLCCAGVDSLLTCAGPQHGPQSQWSSRSAQSTCTARPCFDAAGPAPCASASPWGHSSGSSCRQMALQVRILPRARQACCCLEHGHSKLSTESCADLEQQRPRQQNVPAILQRQKIAQGREACCLQHH